MKILRHFRPKTIGILDTPLIHGLIVFHALEVSILGYGGWRRHKIVRISHKAKGKGGLFRKILKLENCPQLVDVLFMELT